jgi:hypothetical protein
MTAKEAAAATKKANQLAWEKSEADRIRREEETKKFQLDLKDKYPKEMVEKIHKKIEEAASKGLQSLEVSPDWWKDDNGRVVTTAARQLLENEGYHVALISKYYPEYKDTAASCGEGDYSHAAYTEWTLLIKW